MTEIPLSDIPATVLFITLQHFDKYLILLRAVDKLLKGQHFVVIFVEGSENVQYAFFARVLIINVTHHLVDGLHYGDDFVACDGTVSVNVVHVERPTQLLLERPCGERGK